MAKHNKKRNVGLLYEQLMRFASCCILENDQDKARKSVDILYRHFKQGTALYKEFRLFNALVDSRVSSRDVARRIIDESKKACLSHDKNQLRKEKSILIKEINHVLNSTNFYNQKSSKYRTLATVQALLNEWRGADALGPAEIVKYESVLEDWLTRPEVKESSIKKEHANPLTISVMIDKFKTKYAGKMNQDQTELIESYLYDKGDVAEKVNLIKEDVKTKMQIYFRECDNKILTEKRKIVEQKISELEIDASANSVSKAMVLSSLASEMENVNVG
jgi:hypothetical protein